jgi:hypothetical protein
MTDLPFNVHAPTMTQVRQAPIDRDQPIQAIALSGSSEGLRGLEDEKEIRRDPWRNHHCQTR